jgi:5-methylcytosine-specific restriction endonuclease McrA
MLQGNDPWVVIESEVQSFRAGTVRFLEILMHFDQEKLYVEKGYSSLFALLTERYGFSEGQAIRRINCCRAAQVYLPCLDHLANGTISVCALATIQQVMTTENAEALIKKIKGKSIKQIRALVEALKSVAKKAEPLPLFAPRPASTIDTSPSEETNRTISANIVTPLTLTVESSPSRVAVPTDSDPAGLITPSSASALFQSKPPVDLAGATTGRFYCDVQEALTVKSRLTVTPSAKHPLPTSEQIEALNPTTVAEPAKVIRFTGENLHLYRKAEERFGHLREEHLINRVFTVALRSHLPRTTQQRAYNTATRYIPARIREEVLERDGHQCAFVSKDGHRCSERCGLQLDHVVPFSQGGQSTVENLRAMCPAHNQLLAEQAFGKAFMARKRKQGR